MARVVQQRTSPPYLLILFVFLFLIATAIAVVVYLQADESKQKLAKLEETTRKLLTGKEMDSPRVQEMIKNYEKAAANPDKGPPVTVIGQFEERVNRLTQLITGDERHPNPEAVAEDAYKTLGDRPGLAVAVMNAHKDQDGLIAQEKKRTQEKEAELAKLRTDLGAKDKQLTQAAADAADERQQLNNRIKGLDQKLADAQAAHEKATANLGQVKKNEVDALNQTISNKTDETLRLQKKIGDLEIEIVKLKGQRPIGPGPVSVGPKPDGKITKVVGEEIVYINLGAESRVTPGLTFAVYPAKGVPEDANQIKGKIVVTRPDKDLSECRITMMSKRDPIMQDDLILNIAFDPQRKFKFVVEGGFDLYNTGRPGAQGAEEVKGLVRRFGGEVSGEVGTDTDFLVAGSEPPSPPQPADDEPPQVKAARDELQRLRDRYDKAVAEARRNGIPILNANRFLALTGYEPSLAGSR
ncbi:MAG TPA: BRCT domain-containing protein [Phycisphaerae bacterium]|nr:BRCT domain-containing protein [Phycisphaerae bacterium]